jgi:hypothetical protein
MSIFSKLRFSKKNKATGDDLDETMDEVLSEIHKIDDMSDPKKIEQYILDSCEEVISLTKQNEGEKARLRALEGYVSDIDKINSLPEEKRTEIEKTADLIEKKEVSTQNYQNSEKKISDEDYMIMMENEDAIPNEIKKLQQNEDYVEKMRTSLTAIEGEHSEAKIDLDDINKSRGFLKKASIAFYMLYLSGFILVIILKITSKLEMNTLFLLYLLFGAVACVVIYLIETGNAKRRKDAARYLNTVTSILNTTRMKYAAGVNAVEFSKANFGVQSSLELNYKWEAYLEAVRERDKFLSDNEDLSYYSNKLYKLLSPLDLSDINVWLKQTRALKDRDNLLKIKGIFEKRIEALKTDILKNRKAILKERNEINSLMKEHDFYVPEIVEILKSVDKLCGLKPETDEA